MYFFTCRYSVSSSSIALFPVPSRIAEAWSPFSACFALFKVLLSVPCSALDRATSNAHTGSVASRKSCRSGLILSWGWFATRLMNEFRPRARRSMKSALIWNFCTTSFSGSGGTTTPRCFSRNRSCSQLKSLNRRMTSISLFSYCGSVVRVWTRYDTYAPIPFPCSTGSHTWMANSPSAPAAGGPPAGAAPSKLGFVVIVTPRSAGLKSSCAGAAAVSGRSRRGAGGPDSRSGSAASPPTRRAAGAPAPRPAAPPVGVGSGNGRWVGQRAALGSAARGGGFPRALAPSPSPSAL